MSDDIKRNMLAKGMEVQINPQSDRTRKIIVNGVISEILTNAENHPHGIMVKLVGGEVGRVKSLIVMSTEIISSDVDVLKNASSVENLIEDGENHFVEFKSSTLWSQSLDKEAIKKRYIEQYGANTSKVIIAKSISGFLNADGGILLIGIKELKDSDDIEVIGIDSELSKLKDKTLDGYRRMLLDFIIKKYFPSFVFNRINDYIKVSFKNVDSKHVCQLNISKSAKRVFLRLNNEDVFIVRIDASSRQIIGEDLVQYCLDRF